MDTIILKNGTEEVKSIVTATMMTLENLVEIHPIAAYELNEICKNPGHKLFGNAEDILNKFGLMDSNGKIHSSIKNVVLSAFEGKELEIHLTNPIKQDN